VRYNLTNIDKEFDKMDEYEASHATGEIQNELQQYVTQKVIEEEFIGGRNNES